MGTWKKEKQNRFRKAVGLSVLFIGWLFFVGWLFTNFIPHEQATYSIEKTSLNAEESKTKIEYTQEDILEAQGTMETVKRYADIYEEGTHLVVEFKNYVDRNDVVELVTSIADADCVLNGGSRNIYFYDPSNKQIAQAEFNCRNNI